MNVLSLFNGMSCCQIALKELGIKINNYYASEIDKNAIKVTQDNFPNTVQIGDVTLLTDEQLSKLPKIDLVVFGFPCRSRSKATLGREQYHTGLKGISGLFFDCNKVLQWIKNSNNPNVKFLVENVPSNNAQEDDFISQELGVNYISINSKLFSAQDRERIYWTNIPIGELPKENNLIIKDILDDVVDEIYFYTQSFDYFPNKRECGRLHINGHDILKRVYDINYKSPTLTSCRGGNLQKKIYINGRVRKLTENEYRKLQTIPTWYKMNVAKSHIYNMCGDGFTVEVIKHILSGLKD